MSPLHFEELGALVASLALGLIENANRVLFIREVRSEERRVGKECRL